MTERQKEIIELLSQRPKQSPEEWKQRSEARIEKAREKELANIEVLKEEIRKIPDEDLSERDRRFLERSNKLDFENPPASIKHIKRLLIQMAQRHGLSISNVK